MKKTAVVTGASGFIGTHLVAGLKDAGYNVIALDAAPPNKRWMAVTYVRHDIRDRGDLQSLFSGVDTVFHLAALPRVQYSIEHPDETREVNVTGTHNVLEAAKLAGVRRVVFSSSSSVYGDSAPLPTSEDAPLSPMSPYAEHKQMGEEDCKLYADTHAVETVCLRYFNVYGPDADPNGPYAQVIPRFILQRLAGNPMTIVNDGTQTRDLVHVRDVVRANLLAATSDRVGHGEIINIGAGKSLSVNEIAALIGGPTTRGDTRVEPHDTLADISRAREMLGWEPKVSPKEGIEDLKKLHGLD